MISAEELMQLQVVLWSPRQQAFHRETIEEMLKANLNSFFYQENPDSDWIVVGFCNSAQEAIDLADQMRKRFDEGAPGEPHIPRQIYE